MKLEDLIVLIEATGKNDIDKFVYETGDEKIVIRKNAKQNFTVPQPPAAELPALKSTVVTAATEVSDSLMHLESENVVTSPLVGTFYSAPTPEAPPFVRVGDTVRKGQVLAIIEAMKLMNEIESEFDGVVEAVLVNNESVVEYGQPLFRIR